MFPLTVQVAVVVEVKLTGSPELAAALKVAVPPTTSVGATPNTMIWLAAPTTIVCVAVGAAV
jgi:hypothetical protein